MIRTNFNLKIANVKNNIGFLHMATEDGLNGRNTKYSGAEERVTIVAGSLDTLQLTDSEEADRFSLIANLKHNVTERNVFLMRDHVKNTIFIIPNINLHDDVASLIKQCPEIEIHTIAEVAGLMDIRDEVDYDRFIIKSHSNQDVSENVGVTVGSTEYQSFSESLFFSLGNVTEVLGDLCKVRSLVSIPDLKGGVKYIDIVSHNKNLLIQLKP